MRHACHSLISRRAALCASCSPSQFIETLPTQLRELQSILHPSPDGSSIHAEYIVMITITVWCKFFNAIRTVPTSLQVEFSMLFCDLVALVSLLALLAVPIHVSLVISAEVAGKRYVTVFSDAETTPLGDLEMTA